MVSTHDVGGLSPSGRAISMECGKMALQRTFNARDAGSSPVTPTIIFAGLTHQEECLLYTEKAKGSSPLSRTKRRVSTMGSADVL